MEAVQPQREGGSPQPHPPAPPPPPSDPQGNQQHDSAQSLQEPASASEQPLPTDDATPVPGIYMYTII